MVTTEQRKSSITGQTSSLRGSGSIRRAARAGPAVTPARHDHPRERLRGRSTLPRRSHRPASARVGRLRRWLAAPISCRASPARHPASEIRHAGQRAVKVGDRHDSEQQGCHPEPLLWVKRASNASTATTSNCSLLALPWARCSGSACSRKYRLPSEMIADDEEYGGADEEHVRFARRGDEGRQMVGGGRVHSLRHRLILLCRVTRRITLWRERTPGFGE